MAQNGGVPAGMADDIKELLQEEETINKELNEVLTKVKSLRETRDKALNDPKSKVCCARCQLGLCRQALYGGVHFFLYRAV